MTASLILKRGSTSRLSDTWRDDDYVVLRRQFQSPQRAARINSEMSQRSNVEIRSVVFLTVSPSSPRTDRSNRGRGNTGSSPSMTL
jgi:hypothetical protein